MEPSSSSPAMHVILIGHSGHGKTTLLNELAGKQLGETSSGMESCTRKIRQYTFDVPCTDVRPDASTQDKTMQLIVDDTMGFPDSDPAMAAERYDEVVDACNKELNAILWVVKPERTLTSTLEKYKTLMREFSAAQPPIIMIVNGCSNYARLDDAAKDAKRREDEQNFRDIATEIKEAAGLLAVTLIVSTDLEMLSTKVCAELGPALLGTEPKASKLKTLAVLQAELQKAQETGSLADLEEKKRQEALDEAKRKIEEKKLQIGLMKAGFVASSVGACAAPYAPLFGAGAGVVAVSLKIAIDINEKGLAELEAGHDGKAAELAELLGSEEAQKRLKAAAEEAFKFINQLTEALQGVKHKNKQS